MPAGSSCRFLGIIPARGGSKGIPRKNLREVAGKPLLSWTIEAAQAAQRLDRLIVSTEDGEIAALAQTHECEVLPRPKELAQDTSDTLEVLQHVTRHIVCDNVVLLQPTSPIRRPGLIDDCIARFMDAQCDSLATGLICKYVEYGKNDLRRQDLEGFFYDDGNVYVIGGHILAHGDRYGKKIERCVISREQNLDIDDDFDLWMACKILERLNPVGDQ